MGFGRKENTRRTDTYELNLSEIERRLTDGIVEDDSEEILGVRVSDREFKFLEIQT